MDVAARVGSQGGINSMMDQCQAGGGEGKGEAVQRMAGWTARVERWARILREKINAVGLGYIQQNP